MKSEKFVDEIFLRTVNDNVTSYAEMLENLPRDEVKDPYWNELLAFYDKSNDSERKLILKLMRQVSQDSVASLLSIIDGVGYSELDSDLQLKDSSGKQLQGDLADLFIEKSEQSSI